MSDEPFGRQPKPVKVTLEGDNIDIDFWYREFSRCADQLSANTVQKHRNIFTIYPRAVND